VARTTSDGASSMRRTAAPVPAIRIDARDIEIRQLEIGIPRQGQVSASQQAVFDKMAEYAQQHGVSLIVRNIR
jgi:hypothetical protein